MKRQLKTVSDFSENSPFTEAQLRWWIFRQEDNGLRQHGAIVRIGRRVYIDVQAFDKWIESQQVAA
ncbi:DNA-binding protein [Xanthomonas vesicatoria]|uniref:DNA-binding protein n=1 Tax=Xanthomonas vesicatoria TaxID=56460 RepID=UPI001E48F353|nr:DNA-binding protein [Xanthomonas vesicatoria]MCC8619249.1 DNA-binding protein [Xanthomonas vesicatoria]